MSAKAKQRTKTRRKMSKPMLRARNRPLAKCGIMRFSRARMFEKRMIYKRISNQPPKFVEKPKEEKYIIKKVSGEKNGGERKILKIKPPKFYGVVPKRRVKKLTGKKLFKNHQHKLKPSLTPGTVVILLSGRHRGKRCIFLKQLRSGLLLITGPFRLNGCPLRRVNQKLVIGTKTKIDIGELKLDKSLNDNYFRRIKESKKKKKKSDSNIFAVKKEKYEASEQRKKDQVRVDKIIMNAIKKRDDKNYLYGYLASKWGLKKGDFPHQMVF